MIAVFKYMKGCHKKREKEAMDLKLQQSIFTLNLRKKNFKNCRTIKQAA